jgi:hypothetical protein
MRTLILFGLFFALASMTPAQAAECQRVQTSTDRLACHDKLSQPTKPPEARNVRAGPSQYSDETAKEDAYMKRALRPICKGC